MTTPNSSVASFPGYDVVAENSVWDEVTKGVVLARLGPPPPLRFFATHEEATARALVDRLLAQDGDPKVPILEMIDSRLLASQGDGYRYDDMPEDGEAWHRSLQALDDDAMRAYDRTFGECDRPQQIELIENVRGHSGSWHGLPAKRVFSLWLRYASTAFYAHPWAWNEIGFGGPAYPRGYKSLGLDRPEPWEVRESHEVDPIPWARRAEAAKEAHRAPEPPPNPVYADRRDAEADADAEAANP